MKPFALAVSPAIVGALVVLAGRVQAAPEPLVANIVSVIPQGRKSIFIFRGGANQGVEVGLVARCTPRKVLCKVLEVYAFRSKCIADVPSSDLAPPYVCRVPIAYDERRIEANILEVVPEEEATSLRLDRGHSAGLSLDAEVTVAGAPCLPWKIESDTSLCALGHRLEPGARPEVAHVRTWVARRAPAPAADQVLLRPTPTLPPDHVPTAGVPEPARPPTLERAHGHGLVVSRECLGFADDGRAAFLVVKGGGPVDDAPFEVGLEVLRLDLVTGAAPTVLVLHPGRVAEGRERLAKLIRDERLLACHEARPQGHTSSGPDGGSSWVLHHPTGDVVLREAGADLLIVRDPAPPGRLGKVRPHLARVLYVPGMVRIFGGSAGRWRVLGVEPAPAPVPGNP